MKIKLTPHQEKKLTVNRCVSNFCMKRPAPQKSFCHSCTKKKQQSNNPELYTYRVLKNNAKRRNKEFSLTFTDFLIFLQRNPQYMTKKGIRCKSLHIDRIDNLKGYHLDNIRAITLKENYYKRDHSDQYPEEFAEEMPPLEF